MSTHHPARRSGGRQNFTLIELIVVLIVLVGLGTILVPRIPDMLPRTHVAACSNNQVALTKSVEQYEALNFKAPDNYDSLLNDVGSAIFDSMPNSGAGLDVTALTTETAAALTSAGINTLWNQNEASPSATFYEDNTPATPQAEVAVAAAVNIATLTDHAAEHLGLVEEEDRYAVFGIGPKSNLVGQTISTAPVHFPDDPDGSPNNRYGRYGVIYDISGEKAQFLFAVAFSGHGPVGIDHQVAEFFEVLDAEQDDN